MTVPASDENVYSAPASRQEGQEMLERASEETSFVRVFGARTHNLKDISFAFPREKMVVFAGVSGSGKSSLAFETLYAEAQRRYMESVAPHIRHLIDQAQAPDVDQIEGLPPAVALGQNRAGAQERSTVGSVTQIAPVLRLLYSRVGKRPEGGRFLHAEAFSPNTPEGACPLCHGVGKTHLLATEEVLVPDPSKSIREGAIAAWPQGWQKKNLRTILEILAYDIDAPWQDLPQKDRDWILYTETQPSVPVYPGVTQAQRKKAEKEGIPPDYTGTYMSVKKYVLQGYAGGKDSVQKRLAPFVKTAPCAACGGSGVKEEALRVTFEGYTIAGLGALTLTEAKKLFLPYAQGTAPDLPQEPALQEAAKRLTGDMCKRLSQLEALGLGHLALGRRTTQLSSGELQRIRLATQIISKLFGVMYVLDEPAAGLHPQDVISLIKALRLLLSAGSSLMVVEHNLDLLAQADWLVEVGPGPGAEGGKIVYNGPVPGLAQVQSSRLAPYLFEKRYSGLRKRSAPEKWLKIRGISCHNLSDLAVALPLERLCFITGVSGSGKSTLMARVLPFLLQKRDKTRKDSFTEDDEGTISGEIVSGGALVKRLILIDQRPIGRTPRSNLATYTGLFDVVRRLFASTEAAKRRQFDAGRFSFNLAGGRCPVCEGQGQVKIDLMFMPEASAPCTACGGTRYNAQTLEVRWQGYTIADILALTVAEAAKLFEAEESIQRSLSALLDLGLGYLTLGQPATELSGGECQRIKLAWELQRAPKAKTLYLLDEPCTGLHPADSDKVVKVLDKLVQRGDSVVLAEHQMRLAAEADWMIDLGPGAGEKGGKIVAAGTPEMVSRAQNSATAPFLARALEKRTSSLA